jgi:hypothetical protein
VHSTQRIEAVHSAVAQFLRANMLLTALVPALESYSANVASAAETRSIRHALLNESAKKCGAHPHINAAAKVVSPYALLLLTAQVQQASFYLVVEREETPGTYTVTRSWDDEAQRTDVDADAGADVGLASARFSSARTTTLEGCSCQFMDCYGLPCRHMLRVLTLKQALAVPEALLHIRWRPLSPERVRFLTEELRRCRPPRAAGTAGEAALTRDDRFALLMASCRGLADVGATSDSLYERCRLGIAHVLDDLRKPTAPASATARADAAAAAAAARAGGSGGSGGDGGAGGGASGALEAAHGDVCHGCWQSGHRRNSRNCPRYGMPPLPKATRGVRAAAAAAATPLPRNSGPARACRRVPPSRLLGDSSEDDDDDEEGEDTPEDSGDNETVCHRCSKPGVLLCCEGCPHAWHRRCLPADAMPPETTPWLCPVCTGSSAPVGFVGNTPAPPHRGSRHRARKRASAEGTKTQVAAAKRVRRGAPGSRQFR